MYYEDLESEPNPSRNYGYALAGGIGLGFLIGTSAGYATSTNAANTGIGDTVLLYTPIVLSTIATAATRRDMELYELECDISHLSITGVDLASIRGDEPRSLDQLLTDKAVLEDRPSELFVLRGAFHGAACSGTATAIGYGLGYLLGTFTNLF